MPTSRSRSGPRGLDNASMSPWLIEASDESVAPCRITERLMRRRGVAPLMNQYGDM